MSHIRTYIDYLRDILDAITHAQAFVADVDFDAFAHNREKFYAVTRALEIVGEAARNVPPVWQEQYADIPWKDMIGLRNVVAHEYFGVDLAVLWRTVHEDLPLLQTAIAQMLSEMDEDSGTNP